MPEKNLEYNTKIERGYTKVNDYIIDYLKPKIKGRYLDVGCNTGFLLSEMKNGVGIDASRFCVMECIKKGLNASHAWSDDIPFSDNSFDTVVISCTLEQCDDWKKSLDECIRVSKDIVIGINPIPGSPWGIIGKHRTKSVIDPNVLIEKYGATCINIDEHRYYFEIKK